MQKSAQFTSRNVLIKEQRRKFLQVQTAAVHLLFLCPSTISQKHTVLTHSEYIL